MSIASQQRVIEEHQATIRRLRQELAQAKADTRNALQVYRDLTDLCDEFYAAGQDSIPVTIIRTVRPRGTGLGGGRAASA